MPIFYVAKNKILLSKNAFLPGLSMLNSNNYIYIKIKVNKQIFIKCETCKITWKHSMFQTNVSKLKNWCSQKQIKVCSVLHHTIYIYDTNI